MWFYGTIDVVLCYYICGFMLECSNMAMQDEHVVPVPFRHAVLHTINGSQSMCGDVLGIHQLSIAGLVCIEGVKESVLRARGCRPIVLKVGCKALVEPQLSPVVTCHQISKPLQSQLRHS